MTISNVSRAAIPRSGRRLNREPPLLMANRTLRGVARPKRLPIEVTVYAGTFVPAERSTRYSSPTSLQLAAHRFEGARQKAYPPGRSQAQARCQLFHGLARQVISCH
jgi:hypothetical protein